MNIISVLILLVVIFTLLLVYTSYFFAKLVMYPKVFPYLETLKYDIDKGKINEAAFLSLDKEEFNIDSKHGYKLHGFFINNNSKKAVIFTHGHTWSLYGSVKYMDIFLKRGFSVVIYDNRYHGLSSGENTSFGYYEKDDLQTIIDMAEKRLGTDAYIGIHGESMGSGISLETLAIDKRIKFCVADCGYSDLLTLLKIRLKHDYKINLLPIIKLADKIVKFKAKWSFSDVSPIQRMKSVETPVLFIHGEKDNYVPTFMANDMYDAKIGYKEIYLVPEAGHAQAFITNKEEYEHRVDVFLKNIGAI